MNKTSVNKVLPASHICLYSPSSCRLVPSKAKVLSDPLVPTLSKVMGSKLAQEKGQEREKAPAPPLLLVFFRDEVGMKARAILH